MQAYNATRAGATKVSNLVHGYNVYALFLRGKIEFYNNHYLLGKL